MAEGDGRERELGLFKKRWQSLYRRFIRHKWLWISVRSISKAILPSKKEAAKQELRME